MQLPRQMLVADTVRGRNGRLLGIGPSWQGLVPLPVVSAKIADVTRDSSGAILPFARVKLFSAADDVKVGEQVSDANGNYSFAVTPGVVYYTIGYREAISFVGAGAPANSGAGSTITAKLPGGLQADDVMTCVLSGSTGTFPAGWTTRVDHIDGGPGIEEVSVSWKRYAPGDPDLFLTSSIGIAQIAAFRGCVGSGDPFDAGQGVGDGQVLNEGVAAPGFTTSADNSMLILAGGSRSTGDLMSNAQGYSGANPSLTEAFDSCFDDGLNTELVFLAYGEQIAAGPTGDRYARIYTNDGVVDVFGSNSNVMVVVLLALIPASVDVFGTTSNKLVGS